MIPESSGWALYAFELSVLYLVSGEGSNQGFHLALPHARCAALQPEYHFSRI